MNTAPAVREGVNRRARRQLSSGNGEPQAVAGHRIDEAGGIAGQQEAVDRRPADVHGQRSEHDRWSHHPRARESFGQHRIG